MVNECGHPLCRNCVDNIFARQQAPCPTCGKTLRKQTFWVQTFDDPRIEKEVYWRRKLKRVLVFQCASFCKDSHMQIYNLQEDDFPTLRAYNDYLEEFEDIVHNLVNDIDVAKTQARVTLFKEENKAKVLCLMCELEPLSSSPCRLKPINRARQTTSCSFCRRSKRRKWQRRAPKRACNKM